MNNLRRRLMVDEGSLPVGTILDFDYTGEIQDYELPKGTYKLECWGALGESFDTSYIGGKGGYSVGTLTLNSTTTIYIAVGQTGNGNNYSFNGGGRGWNAGAGGGGTDIRIGSTSLYARVIVAGGGGGYGCYHTYQKRSGGYGGGSSGGDGSSYNDAYGAYGGELTYGGSSADGRRIYDSDTKYISVGKFGEGGCLITGRNYVAGGGGGWYGGGCSVEMSAGGGSGYVYTSSTASDYPSGCLLTSSYYLSDASTSAGNTKFTSPSGTNETGHTQNGYVRITKLS